MKDKKPSSSIITYILAVQQTIILLNQIFNWAAYSVRKPQRHLIDSSLNGLERKYLSWTVVDEISQAQEILT